MYNEENVGKISLIKITMQGNKSVAIFCLYYTAINLNIYNFRKKSQESDCDMQPGIFLPRTNLGLHTIRIY